MFRSSETTENGREPKTTCKELELSGNGWKCPEMVGKDRKCP